MTWRWLSDSHTSGHISRDGSCEAEISRRIAITRACVRALQRHIWRSSIMVATKVRLLNYAYVLPVLLYGAETWSLTVALDKKLDAFHQWCLRRLLRLSYLRHVTNVEVLHLTCQTQLSTTLRDRRLRFFGHIARDDIRMDHTRAL